MRIGELLKLLDEIQEDILEVGVVTEGTFHGIKDIICVCGMYSDLTIIKI